ncbi:hypothetical protein TBLA_0D05380 [Henningerozyma blattae CBS 6284]|uniref:EH domain-containing protein n=1 Tax=Henningerozyma blattae (strain ATCC 34711 / CBS 6284 / DSM 70876 / NBRC 10599 / NRRL Y-10934 / UCD 77-7) TaxID=1071380 RepID=I2H3S9_HENB6|nr:hypothetical protein TBLA_0D05380 [Tetrapisispora blattae CBS 6284]CCH61031.1 hypothetical protein TBLA_0D05380 [Tetrapisispora blattae CBS 6284]
MPPTKPLRKQDRRRRVPPTSPLGSTNDPSVSAAQAIFHKDPSKLIDVSSSNTPSSRFTTPDFSKLYSTDDTTLLRRKPSLSIPNTTTTTVSTANSIAIPYTPTTKSTTSSSPNTVSTIIGSNSPPLPDSPLQNDYPSKLKLRSTLRTDKELYKHNKRINNLDHQNSSSNSNLKISRFKLKRNLQKVGAIGVKATKNTPELLIFPMRNSFSNDSNSTHHKHESLPSSDSDSDYYDDDGDDERDYSSMNSDTSKRFYSNDSSESLSSISSPYSTYHGDSSINGQIDATMMNDTPFNNKFPPSTNSKKYHHRLYKQRKRDRIKNKIENFIPSIDSASISSGGNTSPQMLTISSRKHHHRHILSGTSNKSNVITNSLNQVAKNSKARLPKTNANANANPIHHRAHHNHRKQIFNEDKPWKSHQDNTFLTPMERKRYEGVWVTNRYQYLTLLPWWENLISNKKPVFSIDKALSDDEKKGRPLPPKIIIDKDGLIKNKPHDTYLDINYNNHSSKHSIKLPEEGLILNLVVKDIWQRSKISDDLLKQIYQMVDTRKDGTLTRRSFIVGMWLVDQCLYGRKLPSEINQNVWLSADGYGVTNSVHLKKLKQHEKKLMKQEMKHIKREMKNVEL